MQFKTGARHPQAQRTRRVASTAPAPRVVPRTAKRYALAVGGQGLLSAFHFGVNIVLIRALDPVDYGVVALAFVAAGFGAGMSNALAATPLSVYTPGIERAAHRTVLESMFTAVNYLLIAGLFLTTLACAAAMLGSLGTAFGFAAFVAAWTLRHYSRSFAFARRRSEVAFRGDAAYVALGLVLLTAGWVWPLRLDLLTLSLAALSVAHLGSACWGFVALGMARRPLFRRRIFRRYGRIWKDTRWSLLGVVTTTLQSQAHAVIVTTLAGPAAYAPLAAGYVLFGPVRVALQAWHMVMRPEVAIAIARNERQRVIQLLTTSVAVLASLAALAAAMVALFWTSIEGLLYAQNYAPHPMAAIAALWAAVTLFSALQTAPSGVLQAFKDFRNLAVATVLGAALSLAAVGAILTVWSPAASLAGVLLAEVFTFVVLLVCAVTRVHRSSPQPVQPKRRGLPRGSAPRARFFRLDAPDRWRAENGIQARRDDHEGTL